VSHPRTLPKRDRITLKRQFEHLFSVGKRLESHAFRIQFAPPFLDQPMVAFVATRHQGNAVVRNKAKRRLRELFRLRSDALKLPTDLVIIAKRPVTQWPYCQLRSDFNTLLHRIQKISQHGQIQSHRTD
jgi:ribonuclease P protein component